MIRMPCGTSGIFGPGCCDHKLPVPLPASSSKANGALTPRRRDYSSLRTKVKSSSSSGLPLRSNGLGFLHWGTSQRRCRLPCLAVGKLRTPKMMLLRHPLPPSLAPPLLLPPLGRPLINMVDLSVGPALCLPAVLRAQCSRLPRPGHLAQTIRPFSGQLRRSHLKAAMTPRRPFSARDRRVHVAGRVAPLRSPMTNLSLPGCRPHALTC